MNYRILPLNVGNFTAMPKQAFMYRMYNEVTIKAPCIMWCIKGNNHSIMVDLGPPGPEQTLKNHNFIITRTNKEEPSNALKSIGLSPGDINTVIITHLHWDHAWGFHIFPNARFLIQKKEIQYAIAPLPCHRTLYYQASLGKPQFVDFLDKIKIIDGDHEIEDGIEAILIPSHSPGFQGIAVNTENGKYFLAGDAVGLFECWETVPHVPSSLFNNLDDYYDSLKKIEAIADHVLPGHDYRVFEKPIYP